MYYPPGLNETNFMEPTTGTRCMIGCSMSVQYPGSNREELFNSLTLQTNYIFVFCGVNRPKAKVGPGSLRKRRPRYLRVRHLSPELSLSN